MRERAPLMQRDELAEALARLVHLAALDETADLDRQPRVLGRAAPADGPGAGRRGRTRCAGSRPARRVGDGAHITTHKALRCGLDTAFTVYRIWRELLTRPIRREYDRADSAYVAGPVIS